MTIQEAIERLHNLQSLKEDDLSAYIGVWYKGIKDDYDEALKMAIEALSESKRDLSEDTIYRQEAIKILEQICPKRPIGETDVMKAWVKAQTYLMRMPSAQPEIIRCKDCWHYPSEYADCPMIGWARNENDFCSKAERRQDG